MGSGPMVSPCQSYDVRARDVSARSGFIAMAILLLSAAYATAAHDSLGDSLPPGAVQRLGTLRMRYALSVGDLCYLPDGGGVVTTGCSVEIWDLARGRLQAKRRFSGARLTGVVPRTDGKALLIADDSGTVREWDIETDTESRCWATKQARLQRPCYSPDNERVLTTGRRPPTLKEWDLATGSELTAITGKMNYFLNGVYGPKGLTAFVGGGDAGPLLAHYDLATGKLLHQWHEDYRTYVGSLALSADRTRLLLGSRYMATEWLLDGYKQLGKLTGHPGGSVLSVAYCDAQDQILTGSKDGSIQRWNRRNGELLLRWRPHNGYVTRIAVSPDGKWALSYGGGLVAECSTATGEPRARWQRHEDAVNGVAFLPDDRRVVSASSDGTLRVWDIHTGAAVRVIEGAKLGAYAVAVSPSGGKVAAGCKDGVLREFSLSDGKLIRELRGHRGYVRSAAYTHEGARLLSSADDGSICVWDWTGEKPVARLEGHRGGVLCVAISPDDKLVLSGGRDGTVRLWDLDEARHLRTLEGHYGWVEAVEFVGGGRRAASVGRDPFLLSWDLDTGRLANRIEHADRHYALVCSPDGGRAYSAGDDLTIVCWDLTTGKATTKWRGHQKLVTGLALSPDGRFLASSSADTTLLIWEAYSKDKP